MPDTYLELSLHESLRPWWLRLPIVMMGVFLMMIGVATALLRWQMNEVLRTQAALRTEAAWRQAMEDSLTVGLRARDIDGTLVYVNRAFCDLVGFAPEELIGRATPMPYWPPDAIADSMSRHLRNMAGDAPRDGYEARWVRKDGRPIDVMLFEAPLVDASGRHIGWMGSILDITERKRLEERERHQTDSMAHQARLTMLGEVASALAHQLNQPLTSITGYAAGVKRLLERAGQPDARLVDAMTRLGDQAAEAGRIVKRIREFLTRRSPQRETMDLGEAAHRALALLARELRRLQLHVEWAVAPDLPQGRRRPGADRAGGAQPRAQRLRRDGRRARGAAAPAHQHLARGHQRDARRERRRRLPAAGRRRRRPRPARAQRRAARDAVLFDQARRHGHGPGDLPLHHRGAPRRLRRHRQHVRRRALLLHLARGRSVAVVRSCRSTKPIRPRIPRIP